MAIRRRRDLVKSRRKVEDEGEEEAGSDTAPIEDDSLSEATALSDLDDEDADADGSDISEQQELSPAKVEPVKEPAVSHDHAATLNESTPNESTPLPPTGAAPDRTKVTAILGRTARTDTDLMMNGLHLSTEPGDPEEIHFDEMKGDATAGDDIPSVRPAVERPSLPPRSEPTHDRRRRTQEEYRHERDADPTFVPNRGGFFMHDHRHPGPGANGFRPFGRGRGRGRGVGGDSLPVRSSVHAPEPPNGPWAHDLHDSLDQKRPTTSPHPPRTDGRAMATPSKAWQTNRKASALDHSSSQSRRVGTTQIRVLLPQRPEPIVFAAVPVRQHTRLPQHRPPLRRDKPVRISFPDASPRYIFPSVQRSFVFIPRALRPNQQGSGRGGPGGRRAFTSYRTFPSRPASNHGRSVHSPSVSMSRRSSVAREMMPYRDHLRSGGASTPSRPPPGNVPEPEKPVVRLPPAANQATPGPAREAGGAPSARDVVESTVHGAPDPFPTPSSSAAPRADPENVSVPLPMYQPRPQKTVSVAGMGSPVRMPYPPPPPPGQPPFHQQVPRGLNGHGQPLDDRPYRWHSREMSHPSQPSTGTPLPYVPERAIHAQPFQPQQFQVGPSTISGYGPSLPGPTSLHHLYYPSNDHGSGPYSTPMTHHPPAASASMYVPDQAPGSFMLPSRPGAAAPAPTPAGTTVAQESNGMVYYYDAAQLYDAGVPYLPSTTYTVATAPGGVVGMGGMMTPAPDGYYYPPDGHGPVYYGPSPALPAYGP